MPTDISGDLIEAYRRAIFHVPSLAASLRVDEPCEELTALLGSVAFVTACNPFSEIVTVEENARATEHLARALQGFSAAQVLDAEGSDPAGEWPAEPGFLVGGITLEQASELGRQFRQNAILWAGPDAVPRLVLLR